jgi:hypothetical protein
MRSVIIMVLLCIVWTSPAASQSSAENEAIAQQAEAATERALKLLQQQFRDVMPAAERAVLNDIVFKLDRSSWNILDAYARRRSGGRLVVLSRGYVAASDYLDFAVTYEGYKQEFLGQQADGASLMRYSDAVVDTLEKNTKRRMRAEDGVPAPDYLEWIGIRGENKRALFQRLDSDQRFRVMREEVKKAAFAVVLGHEIGHHVLNHLDFGKTTPQQEADADAYGVALAMKAGYLPIGAMGTFILFSAMEGWSAQPNGERSHPPAVCRLARLVQASVTFVRRDRDFIEYLRARGQLERYEALEATFSSILPAARRECGEIR